MKFENVLAEVNGFGKFQLGIVLMMIIPRMTLPFHFLLNNFIAAIPAHHCDISSLDDGGIFRNLSQAERLVVSIPLQDDGTPSSCEMFTKPQYFLLLNTSNITELPTVSCQNGWVYDNTTFKSTLATEWDLVCDMRRLNRATATIYFMGVMFGAALFGYLSDRFGRKRALLLSYVTTTVFGFASAFSTNITVFSAMRFFTGVGLSGISIISFVLCIEWVDIKHRTAAAILMSLDWSVSNSLLSILAYFVNDWRYLTAAATSPLLLAMICWWFGVAGTYYGISLNINGFGMNIYLTQFIYGVIEIPAKAFIYFSVDIIGRRINQVATLVLTGLCIFCNMFIPEAMGLYRTAAGALGKMFAEGAFTTVFLYTVELFPTVIRQNGLGSCSFMARLGVSISPLIMLLEEAWLPLPSVVFILLAFVASISASFLPETKNIRLPETIEEVEQMRRRSFSASDEKCPL
uniref:solute carrier family 22 member 7-like isoform X3 n=1 Tax=Solea senegalensis TaxID=28829 RepID=UPI001CD917A9|nr:solute carrier family 22 member 7-like isoform X3 [Solea senegalensis]